MEDFSSAVLVTALQRALADDGILVEVPRTRGALMPLTTKRRLVGEVAARHGLLPLLRIGLVVPRLPPDPAVAALRAALAPGDLFERWSRLQRFTHSRHRVVVRSAGPTHLAAEHIGPPGAPPTPAEDALVLGVLTGLLVVIGTDGLVVALDRAGARVVFADGAFTSPPAGHSTATWQFRWSSSASRAAPSKDGGTDPVPHARRLLAGDLGHRWTLTRLAAALGTSPRTLQRRLGPGGFAALLGAIRAEAAADLLMTSQHPLSTVGFACGYADQAHFSREFKRRTAFTPAAYRSAFARPLEEMQP